MTNKHWLTTALLCGAVLTTAACKKKAPDAAAGSGSNDMTMGSAGSAVAPVAPPVGSAAAPAPAAKDGLEAASWKNDKGPGKAGPLTFDRQVWTDDGSGNLQIWMISNCPKIAQDCAVVASDQLQPDRLDALCKGYTMMHIAFNPKHGEQKANMGPLKLVPGKYGSKTEPLNSFIEYTNGDRTVGGQSYQEKDQLEITNVTATTIAGTFDTKYNDYAYKGSFTAQKCTCDPSGACK